MKAGAILTALVLLVYGVLVAVGFVVGTIAGWLWDRRWQALAGLVVCALTIAVSAARPGHLWAY